MAAGAGAEVERAAGAALVATLRAPAPVDRPGRAGAARDTAAVVAAGAVDGRAATGRELERRGVAPISMVGKDCCAIAGAAMLNASNEIDER